MAYLKPNCDIYFFEPHEEHEKIFRDRYRKGEQQRNREIQAIIAEDLSQLASAEYRDDILKHMEKMEVDTLPDVASIDIQTEIQWFMRPYLLDFLIEAHTAFGLLPETLFLTINLLDRYCSRRIVYKRHYQLVGCAALLIAAKYGDNKDRVPTIRELKCMCCSLYEDDMFTQMEWHVLQTLGWAIGHPTVDSFLKLALEGVSPDPEVEHMARYISEIAMFHKEFISKRPSDMARSSLALSRCILDRPQPLHCGWAGEYESQTLVTLSQQLHRPSQVLSRKYATAEFSRASSFLEGFLARQASIARCYATPPTPPSDVPSMQVGRNVPQNGMPGPITPQKAQQLSFNVNGCLTPPITPSAPEFSVYSINAKNLGRPPTPANLAPPSAQHYDSQYHLPPIIPPATMF